MSKKKNKVTKYQRHVVRALQRATGVLQEITTDGTTYRWEVCHIEDDALVCAIGERFMGGWRGTRQYFYILPYGRINFIQRNPEPLPPNVVKFLYDAVNELRERRDQLRRGSGLFNDFNIGPTTYRWVLDGLHRSGREVYVTGQVWDEGALSLCWPFIIGSSGKLDVSLAPGDVGDRMKGIVEASHPFQQSYTLLVINDGPDSTTLYLLPNLVLDKEDIKLLKDVNGHHANFSFPDTDKSLHEQLTRLACLLTSGESTVRKDLRGTRWSGRWAKYEINETGPITKRITRVIRSGWH